MFGPPRKSLEGMVNFLECGGPCGTTPNPIYLLLLLFIYNFGGMVGISYLIEI